MPTVTLKNGAYFVYFPYDALLLRSFKNSIPAAGRRWDAQNKCWLVSSSQQSALQQVFPELLIPAPGPDQHQTETRVIELRYLGQVRERQDGEFSAFGYAGQAWSVIFSERVLRAWFEGLEQSSAGRSATLYGLLGIARAASPDEIKSGYRRMARQWHPDVCHEPDASEVFLRIRQAYELLSDPAKRARYDVGLAFEAQNVAVDSQSRTDGYRAPLRCGLVLAEGSENLGRFCVSQILGWEDILDSAGRTLVSSWAMGAERPTESWV